MKSYMLGTLDKGLGLKAKYGDKKRDRMFRDGFGDYSSKKAMALLDQRGLAAFRDITVDLDAIEEASSSHEIEVRRGSFKSPLAEHFPPFEPLKTAHIELVKPAQGSKVHAAMILFPDTGDQGFEYRREKFGFPLARQGIATISLMIPYYAARKPQGQHEHFLRTLHDQAFCSLGCLVEGGKLASWIRDTFLPGVPVGFSGISMGGTYAAGAAILAGGDVVLCPLLAMDGAKTAFFGGAYSATSVGFPPEMTRKEVDEAKSLLDTLSVKRAVGVQEKLQKASKRLIVVRNVTAERDRVTPVTATEELETVLEPISSSYTHVFLKGGHVSALASVTKNFVPEIAKAIIEFRALQKEKSENEI